MKHLLFLLVFSNSFGQYEFQAKPLKFDLLSKSIEIVEVIDLRSEKDILMYSNDTVQSLNRKSNLDSLLLKFFKKSIESSPKSKKLYVVLHEFQFGLRTINDSKLVSIYCELDIYRKVEDGYQKVGSFNDCIEGKAKYTVNELIYIINWQFWNNIMVNVEKKLVNRNKETSVLKENLYLPKKELFFFQSEAKYDAVFQNFDELLNLNSQMTEFNLIKKTDGYEIKNNNGEKLKKNLNIWGIRKYNTIFMCIKPDIFSNYILIPVQKVGNTIEIMQEAGESLIKKLDINNIEKLAFLEANSAVYDLFLNIGLGLEGLISSGISYLISKNNKEKEINKYIINIKDGKLYKVEIYKFN